MTGAVQRLSTIPPVVRVALFAGAVLFMRFLWVSGRVEHGPILCPFRLLTGHPCPLCGSTRALAALCSGDFSSAWHLNPIGVLLALVCSVAFLAPSFAQPLRQGSERLLSGLPKSATGVGVVVVFVEIWAWNLSRW